MQSANVTDQQLWNLIRQGDESAYKQLYFRHFDVLFAAIIQRVGDRQDAEDIVQDVFLTLWEKRQEIQLREKLFSYLYSIMRFKVIRYLKQKNLSERHLTALQLLAEEAPYEAAAPLEKDERAVLLEQTSGQLEGQLRKVYTLKYDAGMSISDIADHLELSPNTVKNHLKAIHKLFRQAAGKLSSVLFQLFL
jgi:RNA polymerase sigma-70 factor (ECF subfamily)